MSFDVLQDKIRAMKNPTVAGLDARIDYVPEHIRQAAFAEHGTGLEGACEAIYQFNVGLIDALCDIVPAVKPQSAYYENLMKCKLAPSKKEARRLVEQGGVEVDGEKVTDVAASYTADQMAGDGLMLKKGKKVFHRVKM